jgi:hypothetical protein
VTAANGRADLTASNGAASVKDTGGDAGLRSTDQWVVITGATGASITATQGGTGFNGAQFGLPSEGNFVVQTDNQLVQAGATGVFVAASAGPAD